MRTFFSNRLFSWTYAIFLLFPVLFETSYFSNPITSTATMSDKKQAAAELAQQYQRLLKLEAQFPMLRKIFANAEDAAIFEPIRLKIEAQIAKQQAAKTETATAALTTAMPPPEPNEDINKDEFEAAINKWAIAQKQGLKNLPANTIISTSTKAKSMNLA
jgi:hypothetical protein